jgi:hypothetical protein
MRVLHLTYSHVWAGPFGTVVPRYSVFQHSYNKIKNSCLIYLFQNGNTVSLNELANRTGCTEVKDCESYELVSISRCVMAVTLVLNYHKSAKK